MKALAQRLAISGMGCAAAFAMGSDARRWSGGRFAGTASELAGRGGAVGRQAERDMVADAMLDAAREALISADLRATDVDHVFIGAHDAMKVWDVRLHGAAQALGLPPGCRITPIDDDTVDFSTGLLLAFQAIERRQSENPLVIFGGAHPMQAGGRLALRAAAGAAVLGREGPFTLCGYSVAPLSCGFGDVRGAAGSQRTCDPAGAEDVPVLMAASLLETHGVSSAETTLLAEAPCPERALRWAERIQPKQYAVARSVGPRVLAALAADLASLQSTPQVAHVLVLSVTPRDHAIVALFRAPTAQGH